MVLSYNFLKKYFDFDYTPTEVYDLFTKHSIEIETMFPISDVKGVVTGKVVSKVKHPESTKLNICNVDYGQGIKQILCGAPNVYEGMITAVAPVGTQLAPDFVISERKLAGELSQGMMCAFSEIVNVDVKSAKYDEGIIDFGTDLEIGLNVNDILGLDDFIFELGITPNRIDLLNFIGQILETKAVFKQSPKVFDFDFDYDDQVELRETKVELKITDKDEDVCEYFNFTHINVKEFALTFAEEYMLMINGISLVNPIVDLGNYAMLVTGQPVHFYDADKIKSNEISIRRARKNEEFIGLDKKLITLCEDDVVIAAQDKVLSLAGVMGSNEFAVDENTENVFFEVGRFNPTLTRKTAARYNFRTDSSFRTERGISREATFDVNYFVKRYLQKHGADVATSKFISSITLDETIISFTLEDLNITAGHEFSVETVKEMLTLLTFDFEEKDGTFDVTISLRHNPFTIKEDIYEEIIRIYGYDKIVPSIPVIDNIVSLNKFEATSRIVKDFFVNKGFNQLITYSLVSEKQTNLFRHTKLKIEDIKLALPLSKDREYLRSNLTTSVFETLNLNIKNKVNNLQLFEIGEIFSNGFNFREKQMLNVMVRGNLFESFSKDSTQMDFFYLKAILGELLVRLNFDLSLLKFDIENICSELHPYQSANIMYNGSYIGYIGNILDKKVKNAFVFEIDFDYLVANYNENIKIGEFSTQPSTQKDYSVVCDVQTQYQSIKDEIIALNLKEVVSIKIKNEFIDEKLGENKKSVLVNVVLNDSEKSLDEATITSLNTTIVNKLNEKFNVQ